MKRLSDLRFIRTAIYLAMAVLLFAEGAWASPTTPEQAKNVVLNWLRKDAVPLGAPLGRQIKDLQTFNDTAGSPVYHVVYLNPTGLVFLPADDLVEPLIGFASGATSYDPSPKNPLGALVSRDIPGRVVAARQVEAQALETGVLLAPQSPQAAAQSKWAALENASSDSQAMGPGLPNISDVRVPPMVQNYYWQSTVAGLACFNYYTPPYSAADPNNYVCGCVATAMAQLMRHHQYPTNGVGTAAFDIKVDGVWKTANLRGGNGSGGPYDWANMPLVPGSGITDAQRQALGALTYDAGVSVNMQYTANNSVSNSSQAAWAYVNVFKYTNAKYGYNNYNNIPLPNLYPMINPNLDSQLPVQLGLCQSGDSGHSILADGYGYNTETMYHHLKMGWWNNPFDDIWYNLPNFTVPGQTYDTVHTCVYNVFKDATGEIISGRVTTAGKTPISGAIVTANRTGGGTYTATTDAKGIYALAKVPSASTYLITVAKAGYTFLPQSAATGTSTDNTITTGNLWGVDFKATSGGGAAVVQLLLMN